MSDIFFQRLESLREIKGFRQYRMAEYMGITPSTYSSYKKDGTEPGLSTISTLAGKITSDELYYLLTGTWPSTMQIDEKERDLIGLYRALSEKKKSAVIESIRPDEDDDGSNPPQAGPKNPPSKKAK